MPKRSPLSYSGALALLDYHDHPIVEKLSDIAGAGLLLAAFPFPPALTLIDPKNEAVKLLNKLLDRTVSRIPSASGRERQDLICAAHTVIVIAALLKAFKVELSRHHESLLSAALLEAAAERARLEAAAEKARLEAAAEGNVLEAAAEGDVLEAAAEGDVLEAAPAASPRKHYVDQLLEMNIPIPSVNFGFHANMRDRIAPIVGDLTASIINQYERIEPWAELAETGDVHQRIVDNALKTYESSYWKLTSQLPDLGIWSSLNEHESTRVRIDRGFGEVKEILLDQTLALAKVYNMLSMVSPGAIPPRSSNRDLLTRAAAAILGKPLLRTAKPPKGVTFPTIEDGFVAPNFRIAVAAAEETVSQREWWSGREVRGDLDSFIAAHLAHPDSSLLPLVIIGHPGAGKSLLTELLAARLPSNEFTVLHVALRHVYSDDNILDQIEHALRLRLKKSVSWGELADECSGTTRVVILDGLDELIQASGVTQSRYLYEVRRFQQEEYDLGRRVVFIVTSRAVALSHAPVPSGCTIINLASFDDSQIMSWVKSWNAANQENRTFKPLKASELKPYGGLVRQPLLLTMIAVGSANRSDFDPHAENFSPSALYERLVEDSIRRQILDKAEALPDDGSLPHLIAERRWLLSITAFGMFNRGRQNVSEPELNEDCDALLGPSEQPRTNSFGAAITRGYRVISDFFFVHVAAADETSDQIDPGVRAPRRSYEFLHATFGEFLVADMTLRLLDALAQRQRTISYEWPVHEDLNDGLLRALLCRRPFLSRLEIVTFMAEMFSSKIEEDRRRVLSILDELVQRARIPVVDSWDRYNLGSQDVVARLATYTANLITMRVFLDSDYVPLSEMAPKDYEPLAWWRSTVRLWQAGLEPDGWRSILRAICAIRSDESDTGPGIRQAGEGELIGPEDLAERKLLLTWPRRGEAALYVGSDRGSDWMTDG